MSARRPGSIEWTLPPHALREPSERVRIGGVLLFCLRSVLWLRRIGCHLGLAVLSVFPLSLCCVLPLRRRPPRSLTLRGCLGTFLILSPQVWVAAVKCHTANVTVQTVVGYTPLVTRTRAEQCLDAWSPCPQVPSWEQETQGTRDWSAGRETWFSVGQLVGVIS